MKLLHVVWLSICERTQRKTTQNMRVMYKDTYMYMCPGMG